MIRKMKRHYKALYILLISSVSLQCVESQKEVFNKELPPEVIASIEKRIDIGSTPGVAIALIDSTGVHYFNFGVTVDGGREVDENSIYEIGSITKVFTGILLAQQVLDGDIRLDDEINNYLPDSVHVPVVGASEIKFGNLTDHTSGLPRMPDNFFPANPNNPYADYTVEQMYEFISTYNPVRTVGSEYEYSNLAQGLLGHLLARNKNTTYENLMVQTIATPLGMKDTRIELTDKMKENLAIGHNAGKITENWDIPTLAGAGAIRSSSSDMARFVSANLGYIESPLAEPMELSHKVRHDNAKGMKVAMGWHIKKGVDGDVVWHNGGTGGYRTFAGFVKETGKGVVVLTNSSVGSDDIGFYLLDPGSKLSDIQSKEDAVSLPESILDRYVGLYEINADLKITITREGTQLIAEPTGQGKIEFYAENETVFFQPVHQIKISFQLKNGVAENLTVFQFGQEFTGKKIE